MDLGEKGGEGELGEVEEIEIVIGCYILYERRIYFSRVTFVYKFKNSYVKGSLELFQLN